MFLVWVPRSLPPQIWVQVRPWFQVGWPLGVLGLRTCVYVYRLLCDRSSDRLFEALGLQAAFFSRITQVLAQLCRVR